jgi:putative phosphoesterase
MAPPRSSRFGLLGDVHAAHETLERALELFAEHDVHEILCVGDIVDGVGDVDRCVELLLEAEAHVVRGNHDRWMVENKLRDLPNAHQQSDVSAATLEFLTELPLTLRFDTDHGPLLLCHGVGVNDMNKLTPDDYGYAIQVNDELQELIASDVRWVVGGHTHTPMDRQFGDLRFVNPGPLHTAEASVAMIDVSEDRLARWPM